MASTGSVIAIVDDDEIVRRALKRLVGSLSYKTAEFSSGEAFLASLENISLSCALLDLHMPGLDGLAVLEAMRSRRIKLPTIVITGNAQPDMRKRCMHAGAVAYLQKPLDRDVVFTTIEAITVAAGGDP